MKREFEYGEGSTTPNEEKGTLKLRRLVGTCKAAEEKVKSELKNEAAEEKGNLVKSKVKIEAAEEKGNIVKSEVKIEAAEEKGNLVKSEVKIEAAEEKVKSELKNEAAEEKGNLVKIEAAEERGMCRTWSLPMVKFLIKKLDEVRKCKNRTINVQFQQLEWKNITKAINQKKFKCPKIGDCQECGTYVVLNTQQVRVKYYKMKRNGCQHLVEIQDNPKYEKERKRWQKICDCTRTKSVAGSSAKALTAHLVSSSCAVGPNTSVLNAQVKGLTSNVWTAMEGLGLGTQLKVKAIKLLHGMDEKMMRLFLLLEPSSQRLYVEESKLE